MRNGTRTAQVMEAIRGQIASRALDVGDRLPSIRGFAAAMKVSPSTVVEAYDRLAAEGIIFARRGAGFFVADMAQPFAVSKVGPRLDRAVDPFWVSRQSLDAGDDFSKPGCGWLPADWMPAGAIRRGLSRLGRADSALLFDYGSTQGSSNLRRMLARQYAGEGMDVDPEQILLTSSGTQAIDLICRFLLRPGDAVLVDDPCYFNFQALIRAHQARAVGVPMTPTGPDADQLGQILSKEKPRLYLTNSALHNPTGARLSPQKAHKVLKIASAHDLIIVEDDKLHSVRGEKLNVRRREHLVIRSCIVKKEGAERKTVCYIVLESSNINLLRLVPVGAVELQRKICYNRDIRVV